MPEDFEKFLKDIPEGVATPLESEKDGDPVEKGQKIINALGVISAQAKIEMLPNIKEVIADLKDLQNKNIRANDESLRNTLMQLIAEEEKIEKTIN
ncbi:MAG TPA: hypothetical protein VMV71_03090 [Candidatus Paceibacterota bacterium]|nr:hypothetical protein [Candidatus Paceibacterota bacterium]